MILINGSIDACSVQVETPSRKFATPEANNKVTRANDGLFGKSSEGERTGKEGRREKLVGEETKSLLCNNNNNNNKEKVKEKRKPKKLI